MENQDKDNRLKQNAGKSLLKGSNVDIAVNKLLNDLKIQKLEYTQQQEELFRIRQELEQAKVVAETAKTTAEGQANAVIAKANGDAQAVEINAKAQAEALRLVSEQIAVNPSLIQYLYVQKLSDKVQLVLLPSNSPFLFDLASLAKANPNLTIPGSSDSGATPTPAPTPAS